MLHKHPESTAQVVAIATQGQPLQAMDASDPNQKTLMVKNVSALSLEQLPKKYILFATATVAVQGQNTQRENCLTIIDSGSQLNLKSRRMTDQFALSTTSTSVSIHVVGQQVQGSSSRHVCCCHC